MFRRRRPAIDPQLAFRAGVMGFAFERHADAADPPVPVVGSGPNERLAIATARLAGLAAAREAFECGRALRAVAMLLDRAGAPRSIGRQFVDNLAAALLAHRARAPRGTPWGAEDTVAMFLEMYERVLAPDAAEAERVRSVLIGYARDEAASLPGERPGRT